MTSLGCQGVERHRPALPVTAASIREVLDFAIGGGWGQEAEFEDSAPVRLIRGTDFDRIRNREFLGVPARYEKSSKVARRILQPGDIVLEISGGSPTSRQSTGRSLFISDQLLKALGEHVIPASFCRLVRLNRDVVDSRYAYYALQEMYVSGRAALYEQQSTGISNFQFEYFLDSEVIRLLSLEEQRAIAHVLGTLDDKIDLNRGMNATLEAMARALFRSWFVDFDPVRAKLEGRDTGLPKAIADLFPDRLVDSELGEIPESWDVSEIGSEVKAVGGGTPSTKEPVYWNGGQHCWATPKDLSKLSSPALLGTDRKITDAGVRKISSGLLPRGTVLLSSRAPIGYLVITEVPTAVNQGFIAMICQKRLPALYVLSWCHEHLERIRDVSGGSTFAEISKQAFRPLPVVVPPKRVLGVYDEASRSLYDRVVSNTRESGLLASLRDALLPKLVSGELRVHGLEPPNGHDDLPAAVQAHGA